MRLELTLHGDRLPTAGELRRKYRHVMAYKRLREYYEWALVAAEGFDSAACLDKPEYRYVHVISYRPGLIRDDDNLHHIVKPLMDAMKNVRLIYDDSRNHIGLSVAQKRDAKNPRTYIYIDTEKP